MGRGRGGRGVMAGRARAGTSIDGSSNGQQAAHSASRPGSLPASKFSRTHQCRRPCSWWAPGCASTRTGRCRGCGQGGQAGAQGGRAGVWGPTQLNLAQAGVAGACSSVGGWCRWPCRALPPPTHNYSSAVSCAPIPPPVVNAIVAAAADGELHCGALGMVWVHGYVGGWVDGPAGARYG